MGFAARKPDFVACEQQGRRPACASTQSDQRLYYSLSGRYNSLPYCVQSFNIIASLCSLEGWFESYHGETPKERFS